MRIRRPGPSVEDLANHLDEYRVGRRYPIHTGSHADAPAPALHDAGAYTWTALVQPRSLGEQSGTVLSHESERGRLTLSLTRIGVPGGSHHCSSKISCDLHVLCPRVTVSVWISGDEGGGKSSRGLQLAIHGPGHAVLRTDDCIGVRLASGGRLLVAARNAAVHAAFRRPGGGSAVIEARASRGPILSRVWRVGSRLLAGWDFSLQISTQAIFDVGPRNLHGH